MAAEGDDASSMECVALPSRLYHRSPLIRKRRRDAPQFIGSEGFKRVEKRRRGALHPIEHPIFVLFHPADERPEVENWCQNAEVPREAG